MPGLAQKDWAKAQISDPSAAISWGFSWMRALILRWGLNFGAEPDVRQSSVQTAIGPIPARDDDAAKWRSAVRIKFARAPRRCPFRGRDSALATAESPD